MSMPTPREAVWAHLRADPAIQALVGSRIYHQQAPPDATYPLIIINTISNIDRRDLAAVFACFTRLQVSCLAASLKEAETLALAVRRSLDGFRGLMAGALPVLEVTADRYEPVLIEETGYTSYDVDLLVLHKGVVTDG